MEPSPENTLTSLSVTNLFSLPQPLPTVEIFIPIIKTDGLLIEKIISVGHTTTPGQWYDQEHDEWVMVVQGDATLAFEDSFADSAEDGSTVNLVAGDYVLIPAHCRHRVVATSHEPVCIWLAIHGDLTCHDLTKKNGNF